MIYNPHPIWFGW